MTTKLRLGLVGANVRSNWGSRTHLPALAKSADFELTAVCTTRMESAEEARRMYGAKLAFDDFRALAACPEVDAVAVVVRAPVHYEPTKAAIEAGKHVYTEWPLGRTSAEAVELTALAHARGVHTAIGLQARVNPVIVHMKEQVDAGYVGEITACVLTLMRAGVLERTAARTWQRDASLGANTLTIAYGHNIDALRFVAGDFGRIGGVVSTRIAQWHETDTGRTVEVTAPDNVLTSGVLKNGAVVSAHVAAIPWAGSGYRMEIYGREGTLAAMGDVWGPQLAGVKLFGARGNNRLAEIVPPARLFHFRDGDPGNDAFNVGQMYCAFAEAIRTGQGRQPTFETALELHHLVDAVAQASESGREVTMR
ncbi:MAG: Gfo/Idh/MocA family oxidoreductase [Burkholderiales bacterium]|nr:Gfo/Idh/MocA family oxidoreductase [Burkholderiales bacterium]